MSNISALNNVTPVIITAEKTVKNQEINNLKKTIKSVSNNIKALNKNCAPDVLKDLKVFYRNSHVSKAIGNIISNKATVRDLNTTISNMKEKINTSSYKHNSSKMKSLEALASQLGSMTDSLKTSNSNIRENIGMTAYNNMTSDPKYKAAEAASAAEMKETHDKFMAENPSYNEGGMVK